ncbi:hypothetical protein [Ralstonia syzygii]|uniref:hypothetical protein n=1 Tax=Ralstonia syzygii TaxID=28097 RepID=UPI0035169BF0
MTAGQFALALWSLASLAVYLGFCMWLVRKSDRIALERDEEQDDERSQRRHF